MVEVEMLPAWAGRIPRPESENSAPDQPVAAEESVLDETPTAADDAAVTDPEAPPVEMAAGTAITDDVVSDTAQDGEERQDVGLAEAEPAVALLVEDDVVDDGAVDVDDEIVEGELVAEPVADDVAVELDPDAIIEGEVLDDVVLDEDAFVEGEVLDEVVDTIEEEVDADWLREAVRGDRDFDQTPLLDEPSGAFLDDSPPERVVASTPKGSAPRRRIGRWGVLVLLLLIALSIAGGALAAFLIGSA